ncbi:RidA family protein [Alloyangia pacifica]|uniref:RidA family protein n=1 Tax=Alloyangia pacifica TaxID=311180 RepID=UPI001CFCA34C|nr:RidA family protein [Alloyangia pacifica]
MSAGLTTRRAPVPAELIAALPAAPAPVGLFRGARRMGNAVYLSGLAPLDEAGVPMTGQVGTDIDLAEARARARRIGLALLANLQAEIGDLNRVSHVVKLNGYVLAAPGFAEIPQVIDGCSDVFIEAFGEDGVHARTSIGAAALPGGISVEVEAIVELLDEA